MLQALRSNTCQAGMIARGTLCVRTSPPPDKTTRRGSHPQGPPACPPCAAFCLERTAIPSPPLRSMPPTGLAPSAVQQSLTRHTFNPRPRPCSPAAVRTRRLKQAAWLFHYYLGSGRRGDRVRKIMAGGVVAGQHAHMELVLKAENEAREVQELTAPGAGAPGLGDPQVRRRAFVWSVGTPECGVIRTFGVENESRTPLGCAAVLCVPGAKKKNVHFTPPPRGCNIVPPVVRVVLPHCFRVRSHGTQSICPSPLVPAVRLTLVPVCFAFLSRQTQQHGRTHDPKKAPPGDDSTPGGEATESIGQAPARVVCEPRNEWSGLLQDSWGLTRAVPFLLIDMY